MQEQDKRLGEPANGIQAALQRGESDEWIVARMMEETAVDEATARFILFGEKGDHGFECCVDLDEPKGER